MILRPKKVRAAISFEVQEYEFQEFVTTNSKKNGQQDSNFEFYQIPVLSEAKRRQEEKLAPIIKKERLAADASGFIISPIIMEHRGIKRQKIEDEKGLLEKQVKEKLELVRHEYEKIGYEEGKKIGYNDVVNKSLHHAQEQLDRLQEMISEVIETKIHLLKVQKNQVLDLLRSLTKWIILRELRDDGEYIQRLLEKLILEVQSRDNLLVKINKDAFQSMPETLEIIQKKLGTLSNMRVEIAHDFNGPGIVVESTNGIIDGSFEVQMEALDRLFNRASSTMMNDANQNENNKDNQEEIQEDKESA